MAAGNGHAQGIEWCHHLFGFSCNGARGSYGKKGCRKTIAKTLRSFRPTQWAKDFNIMPAVGIQKLESRKWKTMASARKCSIRR